MGGARVRRRRFIAWGTAGSLASALPAVPVRAAPVAWKWAVDVPDDHPICVRAVEAFEKILRATGGRLDIRAYPNSALGGDPEMLTQLRLGAIEMLAIAGSILDGIVPVAAIESVAFAFPSNRVAYAAMDGDLGAYIRAELRDKGIFALERAWDNGWRDISNNARPIRTVEDLDGLKLRVSPGKFRVDTFRSLGVAPTPIPAADVYTALQTHLVEGVETPLIAVETFRFFEVVKYASLTHHMWGGFWNLINAEKWAGLAPDLQAAVREHLNAAAALERRDTELVYGSTQDKLRRQGLLINAPAPESFKARLTAAGYYARWRSEFGERAWSALERYTGRIAAG